MGNVIQNARDVHREMQLLALEDRENVYLLHLNAKMELIEKELISRGTLTRSLIHPREVFAKAIANRSFAIILVHNHPSGDPMPSKDDVEITRRLMEVGKLHGIPLLAHVIVTVGGYHEVDPNSTYDHKESCMTVKLEKKEQDIRAVMPLFRSAPFSPLR